MICINRLPKSTPKEDIERIMNGLKCSFDEAYLIYIQDIEIEKKNADPFPLTKEQQKAVKKAKQADRKVNETGEKVVKTRKENPMKSSIILELATFLEKSSENTCENVEIVNKERQLIFSIGGENYELTLVQKRKPKK